MRELFSAFGSEVFRPLVTLFIPGAVAISTWFIGLTLSNDKFCKLVSANHAETSVILVIVGLFVGLLLDDIGATLEKCYLDERVKKVDGHEKHIEEWYDYLRIAFKIEPVGHRYLRNLVMHLKFELGTAIGLFFAAFGIFTIKISVCYRLLIFTSLIMISVYLFFYEAFQTSKTLSRVRRELLKSVAISPKEEE